MKKQVTTQKVIKELNSDTKILIMCWMLKEPRLNVTEITENIKNKTRINISKQINELKSAGILVSTQEGRNNYYSLNKELNNHIVKLIKTIVNTFHTVDEGKDCFVPYE